MAVRETRPADRLTRQCCHRGLASGPGRPTARGRVRFSHTDGPQGARANAVRRSAASKGRMSNRFCKPLAGSVSRRCWKREGGPAGQNSKGQEDVARRAM
jgi:hypothetical protein